MKLVVQNSDENPDPFYGSMWVSIGVYEKIVFIGRNLATPSWMRMVIQKNGEDHYFFYGSMLVYEEKV